jgi:hypothetical protein
MQFCTGSFRLIVGVFFAIHLFLIVIIPRVFIFAGAVLLLSGLLGSLLVRPSSVLLVE